LVGVEAILVYFCFFVPFESKKIRKKWQNNTIFLN
jgi:hypothetical protein